MLQKVRGTVVHMMVLAVALSWVNTGVLVALVRSWTEGVLVELVE